MGVLLSETMEFLGGVSRLPETSRLMRSTVSRSCASVSLHVVWDSIPLQLEGRLRFSSLVQLEASFPITTPVPLEYLPFLRKLEFHDSSLPVT
jgi:hypothetical protein